VTGRARKDVRRRSRASVPLHVATWIEVQTREESAPTVKQRLAAIRHLFDWLVVGHQVAPEESRRLGARGEAGARSRGLEKLGNELSKL
jgi:hypothetical protein